MTDFCILCLTELGCTDPKGWFYCDDTTECICPWCVKEIMDGKE